MNFNEESRGILSLVRKYVEGSTPFCYQRHEISADGELDNSQVQTVQGMACLVSVLKKEVAEEILLRGGTKNFRFDQEHQPVNDEAKELYREILDLMPYIFAQGKQSNWSIPEHYSKSAFIQEGLAKHMLISGMAIAHFYEQATPKVARIIKQYEKAETQESRDFFIQRMKGPSSHFYDVSYYVEEWDGGYDSKIAGELVLDSIQRLYDYRLMGGTDIFYALNAFTIAKMLLDPTWNVPQSRRVEDLESNRERLAYMAA